MGLGAGACLSVTAKQRRQSDGLGWGAAPVPPGEGAGTGWALPSLLHPGKGRWLPLAAAGVPGSLAPGRAAALGQGCPALQRELRGCLRPLRLLSGSCRAAVAKPRIWTF